MKSKIGVTLFVIGFIMAVLGFCSLDTEECYTQVVIFTLVGLAGVGIGGVILQIFD